MCEEMDGEREGLRSSYLFPSPLFLPHTTLPSFPQDHLEDERPLLLEIARYLTHDALQDTNWEKYHGSAMLQGCATSLTEMGATAHEERAALTAFLAAAASSLPEYTPTNA